MKYYVLMLMGFLLSVELEAQHSYSSNEALKIFEGGNYKEAQQAYEYLLKKYDREPKYNYYYGICLLQNNQNLTEAVKRLKYAVVKGVSRDAYYYLGRAYQLNYNFDEAINQYKRFLKYASASDIRNERAELYIAQCETGRQNSAKIYNLTVVSKDTVLKTEFLSYYHPVKDVGQIMRNDDFFESGVDPEGVLYLTERGDQVYFALKDESGRRNLFKMEKLLDGWSDSKALTEINSEWDDMYPYLMIDGQTLFFSSNREGGIGGFDIYKSVYDSESKTFTSPVNMGMPFNSPKDDFLFVTDEFNSKAWFASNRETTDSLVVVYDIVWDNTVVKNLVTDMNMVKDLAALSLSDNARGNKSGGNGTKNTAPLREKHAFRFMVADTLVYTNLDHFNSSEARSYFQESQKLVAQKDSLSDLMRGQRDRYARTNSDTERSMLVNDILLLEKKVYGLDSKIEQAQNNCRYEELNRIKELIREGRYLAPDQVKQKKVQDVKLKEVEIPSEYTYYTNEEFDRQFEKLDKMYQDLFDDFEIQQLKRADSLYVWGHILNLESSRLLEEASNAPATRVPVVSSPFKKSETDENEQSLAEGMIEKSKELKKLAISVYHMSLDEKYNLYKNKIKGLVKQNPTADYTFMEEPQGDANTYFVKAGELMNPIMGYNPEANERAGALKRSGVQLQEDALFLYIEYKKGGAAIAGNNTDEVHKKTMKTYQELQGNVQNSKKNEEPENKIQAQGYEYRIQIGVFRNEPDESALIKIPKTTKTEIPSKGLTKYFAGSYPTYGEASVDLNKVKDAGFSGAFVVVFKDGKQINLTDDLKK